MKLLEVVSLMLWAESPEGYSLPCALIVTDFRFTIGYMHWLEDLCTS